MIQTPRKGFASPVSNCITYMVVTPWQMLATTCSLTALPQAAQAHHPIDPVENGIMSVLHIVYQGPLDRRPV